MSRNSQLLNRAKAFIAQGNLKDARLLVRAVLRETPRDEAAWLCFLETAVNRQDKQKIVHHWVHIDPHNVTAQRLFEQLNTVHYRLPIQQTAIGCWLKARTSVLGLSTMLIVIFMLAVWLFLGNFAVDTVIAQETAVSTDITILHQRLNQANMTIQTLKFEIDQMMQEVKALGDENSGLNSRIARYEANATAYEKNAITMQTNGEQLAQENGRLKIELAIANQQIAEQANLLGRSGAVPSIRVENGFIILSHQLSDNRLVQIDIPYSKLEESYYNGNTLKGYNQQITVITKANMRGQAMDFRPLIDAQAVQEIADNIALYHHNDDEKIIDELWRLTSQLSQISPSLANTPRPPLDTLVQGQGDAEDKLILLASLLTAVNKDWDIWLLYMDTNSPSNPHEANHAIIKVDTGTKTFHLDASGTIMEPYSEPISMDWAHRIK